MAFLEDHKAKFDDLLIGLKLQNREQIRRNANGGNSILFVYPPEEEHLYLNKASEILDEKNYKFINIADLFVRYIDKEGWSDFSEFYKDSSATSYRVFNSDDEEEDLMDMIIAEIVDAEEKGLIPVLVRTGALYGTGIENVNIMENNTVMQLKYPLIIFYPAKVKDNNLYFLNFKPASKYRCTIIE